MFALESETAALIAGSAGALLLFLLIFLIPSGFKDRKERDDSRAMAETPQADPSPGDVKKEGGAGWGCGAAFFVTFIIVKLIVKFLQKADINWNWILEAAPFLVLILAMAFFYIWFGISKIRLRRKLGSVAAVSGSVDLFTVVAILAIIVWIVTAFILAAMDEQELDFSDSRVQVPHLIGMIVDIGWILMNSFLLLSIRNLAERWPHESGWSDPL